MGHRIFLKSSWRHEVFINSMDPLLKSYSHIGLSSSPGAVLDSTSYGKLFLAKICSQKLNIVLLGKLKRRID